MISSARAAHRWCAPALAVAVALASLWFAAASRADDAGDRAEALRALHEGNRLFDLADFPAALDAYQRAYARVPSPKLLFNLGQTYRNLGRLGEAREAYRRFLAEAHDAAPALRAEAEQRIEEIASAGSPALEVPAPPPSPPAPPKPPKPVAPRDGAAPPAGAPAIAASRASSVAPPSDPSPVGLLVRADVDRALAGAGGAAALTLALGSHFDAAAGGFWWPARGRGVWGASLGGVAYLSSGRWRPLLAADAQLFFAGGTHPAARAAAGVQGRLTRRLALFAVASVEILGSSFDERITFVPAAGVQVR